MYVYIQSEPQLWTVGFYSPDGKWHPDSDHDKRVDAAKRTNFLNGGLRSCEDDNNEFLHGCEIPDKLKILTVGDLRMGLCCLEDHDQVVVEIHEGLRSEDLYPFYIDVIGGIQLVDDKGNPTIKVNEVRFCI